MLVTNLLVVVSRVVAAVQRVGVPVTIQALEPPCSLPSAGGGGGGGVVHCAVLQDGFGGSTGFD